MSPEPVGVTSLVLFLFILYLVSPSFAASLNEGCRADCPAGFLKTAWRKPSKNKLSSSFKHLGMRTHEWNLIFCSWLRRFQHAKSCFNCIHLFSPGYGGEQPLELFSLVWEMSFWKGREGKAAGTVLCSSLLQCFTCCSSGLGFGQGTSVAWPCFAVKYSHNEADPVKNEAKANSSSPDFPFFLFMHLFQRPKVLFLWDYFSF